MATFKKGDRVKHVLSGDTGVFIGYADDDICPYHACIVVFDAPWPNIFGEVLPATTPAYCRAENLAPLTPPDAKTLTAEDILALPDLREADCPLPVPLRMTGLVA